MNLKDIFKLAGVKTALTEALVLRLEEGFSAPDPEATKQAAAPLLQALQKAFPGSVRATPTNDGYIQFELVGSEHTDPQALSQAIDPYFRDFRSKGWTFTQPVQNKFLIGVPAQ